MNREEFKVAITHLLESQAKQIMTMIDSVEWETQVAPSIGWERAKGCTSGRHKHHTWVPWLYNKPYDKACDICGIPAAWIAGLENERWHTPLCDCHAEDWSRWNGKDGRLDHNRSQWFALFQEFKQEVLSGKFIPDDFKVSKIP